MKAKNSAKAKKGRELGTYKAAKELVKRAKG